MLKSLLVSNIICLPEAGVGAGEEAVPDAEEAATVFQSSPSSAITAISSPT